MSNIPLILEAVEDGSQPLISRFYAERNFKKFKSIRRLAYVFSVVIAIIGGGILYATKDTIGVLLGASYSVNSGISETLPILLLYLPFLAVTRITITSFYAVKKSVLSYVLVFTEPVLMLVLMLSLPVLFGGQCMVWWSVTVSRILIAALAVALKQHVDRQERYCDAVTAEASMMQRNTA